MSYRQIARELNVAINVVGVSLYRAKSKLRAALTATRVKNSEIDGE